MALTAIDLARSRTRSWSLEPPVFAGGYGQLEVPQMLCVGRRWYCLFCTSAEHVSRAKAEAEVAAVPGGPVTGTHYLVGAGPRGPWRIAPGRFLDGALPCRRYAGRLVETDEGLRLLGFANRPGGGGFAGHVTDPEPVVIDAQGRLALGAAG